MCHVQLCAWRAFGRRSTTKRASVGTKDGCTLATTPRAAMRSTRSRPSTWQCVSTGRRSTGGDVDNDDDEDDDEDDADDDDADDDGEISDV